MTHNHLANIHCTVDYIEHWHCPGLYVNLAVLVQVPIHNNTILLLTDFTKMVRNDKWGMLIGQDDLQSKHIGTF